MPQSKDPYAHIFPVSSRPGALLIPEDGVYTREWYEKAFPGGEEFLRQLIALPDNQRSNPTTTPEAADARHETPESAAVRPAVRAAASAGERGTVGQKAARRRAKSA